MSEFKVVCPFCLYVDNIIRFRMKLKRGGYSRKRYQCPDCNQVMRKKTLTREATLHDLAEWLYVCIRMFNKPNEKFYDRISWEKLSDRLKKRGWANDFWESWKTIKENFELYSKEEINFILDGYSRKKIDLLLGTEKQYYDEQRRLSEWISKK